jgi:subtilisin family serine protease
VGTRPVSLALILLALLPASAAANSTARIIVQREAGLSAAERADVRADADVRFVESLPLPRTEVVAAAPGDVRDAVRDLNADPDVVYAERDRPIAASSDLETDPLWGLTAIDALDAWGIATGLNLTVAVVDSGVDASHPDLEDRIAPDGYDWVGDDDDPDDLDGHGTHVAGILAATRDNDGAATVAGVAHGVSILPLRVLDEDGDGLVSDAIQAYDYAAERGIRIVNASLSGAGALNSEYQAIKRHSDVLFVVAAGNGGDDGVGDDNDGSADANYPCAYDLPNVLCVGASDQSDEPAPFSNFGDETVEVFAPGVGIKSTIPGGFYDFWDGTSMATPHVAGTAALLLQQTPELSAEDVVDAVVDWADDNVHLDGLSVSGGRANAFRALTNNDADQDGVADAVDNCPVDNNPVQSADADGDGAADACDPTLRGADLDGDGWGALDDQCPDAYGSVRGCPAPPPVTPPTTGTPDDADGDGVTGASDACPSIAAATRDGCPLPQVASVSARVKNHSATVSVSTSRTATVRMAVERKRGRGWVRVSRTTLVTSGNRARVTVRRLRRGAHRVRISVSTSSGSGTPVTKGFRVR